MLHKETEHCGTRTMSTNKEVCSKIKAATEEYGEILSLVKKWKFRIS